MCTPYIYIHTGEGGLSRYHILYGDEPTPPGILLPSQKDGRAQSKQDPSPFSFGPAVVPHDLKNRRGVYLISEKATSNSNRTWEKAAVTTGTLPFFLPRNPGIEPVSPSPNNTPPAKIQNPSPIKTPTDHLFKITETVFPNTGEAITAIIKGSTSDRISKAIQEQTRLARIHTDRLATIQSLRDAANQHENQNKDLSSQQPLATLYNLLLNEAQQLQKADFSCAHAAIRETLQKDLNTVRPKILPGSQNIFDYLRHKYKFEFRGIQGLEESTYPPKPLFAKAPEAVTVKKRGRPKRKLVDTEE